MFHHPAHAPIDSHDLRRSGAASMLADFARLAILAAVAWGLVLIFDAHINAGSPLRLQCLNVLPVYLLLLVLWGLTGRVLFSGACTAALLSSLFYASGVKFSVLQEPLISSDLLLLGQVFSNLPFFLRYASSPLFLGAAGAAAGTLIIGLMVFEQPRIVSRRVGFAFAAAAALSFAALLNIGIKQNSLYQDHAERWIPWAPSVNFVNFGLIYTFFKDAGPMQAPAPLADPAVAAQWRARHEDALRLLPADGGERPDIVFFLSEAFFDPGILQGIEECRFIPNFCSLAQRGTSGFLTTPAFGGTTLRTEFEVLTGVGMENFPAHEFPYYSLVTSKVPSLLWDLSALGYRTTALHPFKRSFWNRHAAYPLLGFQRFLDESAFANARRSGLFVADTEINQTIKALLASEERQFIFAITMENHGPWDKAADIDAEAEATVPVPPTLTADLAAQWRRYIYHLQNADRALKDLAAYIQARKRHTLFVFFGDHLPALQPIFAALRFKQQGRTAEPATKYLILDNRSNAEVRIDTDAEYLAALALEHARFLPNEFFRSSVLLARELAQVKPRTEAEQMVLHPAKHIQLLRFQGLDRTLHK